jgi:hypothetical protein
MDKLSPQGILLKSELEIQIESDHLNARNMLQFALAENLNFKEQSEGASFEQFVDKYAESIGVVLGKHPEVLLEYEALLKVGKEDQYDFHKLKELIKPYLPTLH